MILIFVNGLTEKQSRFFTNSWCPILRIHKFLDIDEIEEAIKNWLNGEKQKEKIETLRSIENVEIIENKFKIKYGIKTIGEIELV